MTAVPTPARVLVLGSGGREHALAWALSRDPGVEQVVVSPGNPGMTDVARVEPGAGTDEADARWLRELVDREAIDLVVIGPEQPLVDGLADDLTSHGVAVFGPEAAGARLEGSKTFCREIAEAAGVPMAEGRSFDDPDDAAAFARALGAPVVIKADGLAGGKGVSVCLTLEDADASIGACAPRFGSAGRTVVVERALEGLEVSVICLTDGDALLALPAARDHKRVADSDQGPNTGGMGAYSPLEDVSDEAAAALARRFHRPILDELARRGIGFRGALYAGLMLTDEGPYLLECNVRFGDPETQVLLPRLQAPLASLLLATATGRLRETADALGLPRDRVPGTDAAAGVVLAAQGYPDAPRLGQPITVERRPTEPGLLFWAGIRRSADGRLVTSGGRVATAVGRGASIADAARSAYVVADGVTFAGRHMRRDIGCRAASIETSGAAT